MLPPSRFGSKAAALLVAGLLLVGTTTARAAAPVPAAGPAPVPAPQVHKTTIYNGLVPTVSYSVQGGSPHLQALAQTLQFTENEINVTGELQRLRLGIVANEQLLDTVRTSQQLGLGPISAPGSCYAASDSALKSALIPGLAREATPAAAYGLINMWEQTLTEVQAEAKGAVVQGVPAANPNARPAAPVAEAPVAIRHLGAPATGPAATPRTLGQSSPMSLVGFPASAAPQFPTPMNSQQVTAFQQMVRDRIARAQQQMLARR